MFIDEKSGKMFTWILGYDLRRIVEACEPRYDHSGAPFLASKFRICGLSVLCCSAGNGQNGDFCLRQSRDMLRCTTSIDINRRCGIYRSEDHTPELHSPHHLSSHL